MKWKFKGKGNKKTGEFYRYGAFSNIKRRKTHGKGGYRTYRKLKK